VQELIVRIGHHTVVRSIASARDWSVFLRFSWISSPMNQVPYFFTFGPYSRLAELLQVALDRVKIGGIIDGGA
jgi:hypothetical protein